MKALRRLIKPKILILLFLITMMETKRATQGQLDLFPRKGRKEAEEETLRE